MTLATRVRSALVAAAGVLALTACGGSSGGSNPDIAQVQASNPSESSGPSGPCAPAPSTSPKHESFSAEPKLAIARVPYVATVVTNCGTITVSLDGKHAPHTVNSFAFLASKGYFDHTTCHRLTTSGIYVLQCGDPTGTGTGGPGYTLPDENLAHATYRAGVVAMANTGQPHTGGSQFFFVYADTPLPAQYTPFGHVTSGLDVLRKIAAAGSNNSNGPGDGAPNAKVVIESFRVTKA